MLESTCCRYSIDSWNEKMLLQIPVVPSNIKVLVQPLVTYFRKYGFSLSLPSLKYQKACSQILYATMRFLVLPFIVSQFKSIPLNFWKSSI